jgi:hypothetical protein
MWLPRHILAVSKRAADLKQIKRIYKTFQDNLPSVYSYSDAENKFAVLDIWQTHQQGASACASARCS